MYISILSLLSTLIHPQRIHEIIGTWIQEEPSRPAMNWKFLLMIEDLFTVSNKEI